MPRKDPTTAPPKPAPKPTQDADSPVLRLIRMFAAVPSASLDQIGFTGSLAKSVITQSGAVRIAHLIGVTPSLVYRWALPDKRVPTRHAAHKAVGHPQVWENRDKGRGGNGLVPEQHHDAIRSAAELLRLDMNKVEKILATGSPRPAGGPATGAGAPAVDSGSPREVVGNRRAD